jgi:hypothetical protein
MEVEKPKTLVIIIGSSRGSEIAWKSLQTRLLTPMNADLALVLGRGEPINSLYKTSKYTKLVDEYDDWGECIDYISKKEGETSPLSPDWRKFLLHNSVLGNGLWGGIKHNGKKLAGSGTIIFCMRYFVKELIEEQKLLDKYDRFIITRSDHYYEFDHATDLSNENIWIPEGEDYGGITGRHIVLNKDHVMTSLDIIPWCLRKREKFEGNPERLLKYFYTNIGILPKIKRFTRSFFIVKTKTDQTRWGGKNGIFVKDIGLMSKYTNEYKLCMKSKALK